MQPNILVVGDAMLDVRLDCTCTRLSPEAPVPIHSVQADIAYVGGAANVAVNIKAMCPQANVTLLAAVGRDDAGRALADLLLEHAVSLLPVHVDRTTVKTRVFTDRTMRARIDSDYAVPADKTRALTEDFLLLVRDHDFDCIVFSDYGKGALASVDAMLDVVPRAIPTIVDPKGTGWDRYTGATYIKCNKAEYAQAMEEYPAVSDMAVQLGIDALIVTAGAEGSTVYYGDYRKRPVLVMPLHVACVDPTGAGDSYLAALAVELARRTPLVAACQRASVAGALATTVVGTKIVTAEELDKCVNALNED